MIILINGLKRSGKDFTASLIQEIDPSFVKLAFADNIKQIISTAFDISEDDLDKYKNQLYPILTTINGAYVSLSDFRTLLQKFGTEAMKPLFGDDVWVNLVKDTIIKNNYKNVVISDFRFLIEYEVLKKEFDIITIKIKDKNLHSDEHISENELKNFNFDYVIDNTIKNKVKLKENLIKIMKKEGLI